MPTAFPDNRFNWVQFDKPVFTSDGAEIRTIRNESNDSGTAIHDCHLNRHSNAWFLGKCTDDHGPPSQGLE